MGSTFCRVEKPFSSLDGKGAVLSHSTHPGGAVGGGKGEFPVSLNLHPKGGKQIIGGRTHIGNTVHQQEPPALLEIFLQPIKFIGRKLFNRIDDDEHAGIFYVFFKGFAGKRVVANPQHPLIENLKASLPLFGKPLQGELIISVFLLKHYFGVGGTGMGKWICPLCQGLADKRGLKKGRRQQVSPARYKRHLPSFPVGRFSPPLQNRLPPG